MQERSSDIVWEACVEDGNSTRTTAGRDVAMFGNELAAAVDSAGVGASIACWMILPHGRMQPAFLGDRTSRGWSWRESGGKTSAARS